jgi:AraC-like DNA-binding protein
VDEQLSNSLMQVHAALRKDEASRLEQEGMVLDTLAQLITRFSQEHYTERPYAKEHRVVKRAQEYLQEHYAQQVSLEQLSAVTQLSVFHLSRVFCAEVGLPPHIYQMQLRIAHAKALLAQQHSIAQTALSTGFASQSHFGMHFKRLVGITPLQYMQDSKNTIDRGG